MENENQVLQPPNLSQSPQPPVESDEEILNRVILGRFDNLPSISSKIVRIFTSSTFTDTAVERNLLIENVYPKLKDYCREQHGLEFQVVDMRWGVRDESTDDHKTTELCMQEIDNCQRLSLGPNFVVFLGQKYGYRPLPTRVLDTEFVMIIDVLEEEDGKLLKTWYKLDTNSVPNLYVLQPVSSIYKNFTNKANKAQMEEDQSAWWKTMGQLCTTIRKGAARLLEMKKFSIEDNHRYNWSVTEQEVVRGILISKDNVEHTLAFIREIRNINVKLFTHSAKFIDINFAARKVDDEAQSMLSLLRDVKVPQALDAQSIIPYSIEWSDNEGINKVDHASYLKEFTETFYVRIIDLIERAISRQSKLCHNKLYSEVLQHLHFCTSFTKLFKGRDQLLDQIKSYIKNDERNQPFVMDGPSGCGKSSILAKVALMVRPWMGSKCTPVVIVRFLGTTPDSSSVYPLIKSICHQISANYQIPIDQIPIELSNLTNHLKKLLENATVEKPLFIFLDSLDQLSATNSAHSLSWMPVNLPKNVKIIVSTLSGYYGIVETLHNMIEIPENFAQVEPLGESLALDVIFEMLKNNQRTISETQLPIVQKVLQQCNSPLYVKLVLDQVSLWKSYTTELNIAYTIDDCVSKLFERVENSHGKVLVSHALAFITASKNGLSEAELEDLISLDETVLNDIYQYHLPPIRRIPPLLWTRIRNDIPSYLSEREADGVSVVFWYHRQFIQVSSKRFLSNQKFRNYVHSQIADYFMGVWANVPKPYSYTEEQKRMFMLKSLHGEADRKVPAQPEIFYNPVDNSVRYNGRKLSELPFHLIRSKRIEELYTKVLFHYKFLYAKLSCMPLNSLIADFEDCLASYKYDKEVVLVSDALRLASSILSVSASNLVPQIIGRLLPYIFMNTKKFSNVKSLILECESDGLKDCAFVPAFNCFHVPGGPLVYSLDAHPFAVYGISLISGGTQLLSVSNRFIIFDLSSGDVVRNINPSIEGIMQSLSVSSDKKYCVSFSNNDQIVICNVISGDVKILNRYSSTTTSTTTPTVTTTTNATNQQTTNSHQPEKHHNQPQQQQPKGSNAGKNSTKDASKDHKDKESAATNAGPKEYTDTLIGTFTGLRYFVIWSKYYYYVYDKKARIVKAEKLKYPIIQIEIIENKSIENYGVELEMITRAEDCRDDEDKDRDQLILEYIFVLDPKKVPKKNPKDKNDTTKEIPESDILKQYVASCNRIEIHSCLILTRDKKKLFTCTEIADNVIECFRNRADRYRDSSEPRKNVWKYHGSLDDNLDKIFALVLSDDENYMLAVVVWGFKVFFLLTGQSKPLRFPVGVKNIQIGYKKLSFPALFSKDNRYVVAGVRDNIYLWDTSYGTYLKTLDAHYGRITNLLGSCKEQKNLVLSCSMDKTIKIWNLNNIMEEDFPLDHLEKPIEALHVSILACIALAQSRNQLVVISLKDGRIKYQLCHNPHGAIFNCSAMSSTGTFAASSESNRLVIWDVEERKATYVSSSQSNLVHIKQLQFHQSEIYILCATLDTTTKTVTITNYTIPDGEVVYTIEYSLKAVTDYKNFVVSSDETYLVAFRNDKKCDMLAVYLASDGSQVHNVKLQYTNYTDIISMVPMHKNPNHIALIDADKGSIMNIKEKKYVRSVSKWNGKATKDDKNGLYAPARGGLEVLDLKNGNKVKILIPKIAEGVFDVDTLITENDKHVIYYHSGRKTIRAFRLEDGKKIADYKSTARVRCMVCTQDSRSIVIGCEDGTVNMLIIADPELDDYVNYLREWRDDQMNLFARDVAASPTPPTEPTHSTILFKALNAFTQIFDTVNNGESGESQERPSLEFTRNEAENKETKEETVEAATENQETSNNNETNLVEEITEVNLTNDENIKLDDENLLNENETKSNQQQEQSSQDVNEPKQEQEVLNESENKSNESQMDKEQNESIQEPTIKETLISDDSNKSRTSSSSSGSKSLIAKNQHDDDDDIVVPEAVKTSLLKARAKQESNQLFISSVSSSSSSPSSPSLPPPPPTQANIPRSPSSTSIKLISRPQSSSSLKATNTNNERRKSSSSSRSGSVAKDRN